MLAAKQALQQKIAESRIDTLYPETGLLRRELYPKHTEFFAAGAVHQERAFIAGNRVGKTTAAAYEATLHLTGDYPKWWEGRRFDRPTTGWAAGEDAKTVRETVQLMLLGAPGLHGTGMIPKRRLSGTTARGGIPDAVDTATIEHVSGGSSRLVLKSYDQKREAFQGAKVDLVWFDEEPPLSVYMEGLTRTMATVPGDANGLVMCTFTPLKGLSDVVLLYLPGGKMAGAV